MVRPAVARPRRCSLSIVAIVGKLVSAGGTSGLRVDRLLVGIGMIPRGEVGIIFASIGLAEGVLGDDQYAALLLVILVTTLMTPPLLRWRVAGLRVAESSGDAGDDGGPDWDIAVVGDRIVLRGQPPTPQTVPLALDVARLAPLASPDTTVDRLVRGTGEQPTWRGARRTPTRLVAVLQEGDARSLRFLDVTGVLDRALPEVGAALARRRADPGRARPDARPAVAHGAAHRRSAPTARPCSPASSPTSARRVSLAAPNRWPRGSTPARRRRSSKRSTGRRCSTGRWPTLTPSASRASSSSPSTSATRAPSRLRMPSPLPRLDEDDWRRKELDEIRDRVLTALAHPDLLDRCGHARRDSAARRAGEPRAARRRRPVASREGVADVPHVARPGRAGPPGIARRHVATTRRRSSRRRRRHRARTRTASTCRAATARACSPASPTRSPSSGLDVVDGLVDDLAGRRRCSTRSSSAAPRARIPACSPSGWSGASGAASRSTPLADLDVTFDDTVFPWHTQCIVRGPDRPRAAGGDRRRVRQRQGRRPRRPRRHRCRRRRRREPLPGHRPPRTQARSARRGRRCSPPSVGPLSAEVTRRNTAYTLETSRRLRRNEPSYCRHEAPDQPAIASSEVTDALVRYAAGRPGRGDHRPRRPTQHAVGGHRRGPGDLHAGGVRPRRDRVLSCQARRPRGQHELRHLRARLRRVLPDRLPAVAERDGHDRLLRRARRPGRQPADRLGQLDLPVQGRLGPLRRRHRRRCRGDLPLHGRVHGHHGDDPHRGDGRALEVGQLRRSGASSAAPSTTRCSPPGRGAAAGCRRRGTRSTSAPATSTSPAPASSTRSVASPPSPARSCSGRASASTTPTASRARSPATTSRWPCSARSSCCSAGSASTPPRRSPPPTCSSPSSPRTPRSPGPSVPSWRCCGSPVAPASRTRG